MKKSELLGWLKETNPERLKNLWDKADRIRRIEMGDQVYLRGLVEISNRCSRMCTYCGLRAANKAVKRYEMSENEILKCAARAKKLGFGTTVMQSGENIGISPQKVAKIIRKIKSSYGLTVTLSLGEHAEKDLRLWREAGADRYLLRFETSDPDLYSNLHPDKPGGLQARIEQLTLMHRLGYEIGGGIMVGLPGQTLDSIVEDLRLFRDLELDMVGIGPYIPNPDTPSGLQVGSRDSDTAEATHEMATKVLALTRLVCPAANLPATTALAAAKQSGGRASALARGANVIMPNLTPAKFAKEYKLYPSKARTENINTQQPPAKIRDDLKKIGRYPATDG